MNLFQAMESRHSVRNYLPKPLEAEHADALNREIIACNIESGLNIRLAVNEYEAFKGFTATYGLLKNVRNYIALIGKDMPDLDEKAGYFGERIVLRAQQLGLNTCWVGGSYKKSKVVYPPEEGERLVCVIAVGYGVNQGKPHRNRPVSALCRCNEEMPVWFKKGMEAALMAPTAVNQQKFLISLLSENTVKAENTGGFYSKVDLGIVKYHFEIGAGKDNFKWV